MLLMATFRLVLPKAPWLSCLEELRLCYGWALRDAGHAVTYADWYLGAEEAGEDYQMAFGAHAVPPPQDPKRMVIAQSEHHERHFSPEYRETLSRARLAVNMGPFQLPAPVCGVATDGNGTNFSWGGKPVSVECPPGILSIDRAVEHSPLWVAERRFDVVHYGSLTPRRARIFEALAKAGITVTALFGVLGQERDWYIDRAKIVLDLKQEGEEPDDQTRAFWALSRGACVLSENALCEALRITPETVVSHVRNTLDGGKNEQARLRDAYAQDIGRCNVAPMLKALGL